MLSQDDFTDSPKQAVLKILTMLPDDISFDELLKELVFEWQVQRGLKLRSSADHRIDFNGGNIY